MNCANHTDASAVAYCRTCGKPLCATCTRDVRGVIYCENCLAARLEGVQPPAAQGPPPSAPIYSQPAAQGAPNPALAGILAGFFPFGVGAVYCGQYAKGLAHLVIFTLLVIGSSSGSDTAGTLFGLGIAFFYVYQIIDAVRTARALQMGLPVPDPFGLGQTFGAGEKFNKSKVPTGAVVLIIVGIFFLLRNTGLFDFDIHKVWPIFLIALGGWLFARNWGVVGGLGAGACYCSRCRHRRLMGPAVLVTIGVLSLMDELTRYGWHRTWPVLLLVIGIVSLLRSNASGEGHVSRNLPEGGGNVVPRTDTTSVSPPPVNEVRNV
jgi:Domain of unknown function (DUF5668)/B-box zinc finger